MPEARISISPKLTGFDLTASREFQWTRTYTEGGSYIEAIPDATVDQLMTMVGVTTAKMVVVAAVDKTLTVRLNVITGTAIVLDAGGVLVLAGAAITAIYVSNSSGATARVVVMLVD